MAFFQAPHQLLVAVRQRRRYFSDYRCAGSLRRFDLLFGSLTIYFVGFFYVPSKAQTRDHPFMVLSRDRKPLSCSGIRISDLNKDESLRFKLRPRSIIFSNVP